MRKFIEGPTSVDWAEEPWASAHAALHWLGLAPRPDAFVGTMLAPDELKDLAHAIAARLVGHALQSGWSSQWIADAIAAAALAEGGLPESLVREVMLVTSHVELDARFYEFSREFGRQLLGGYRKKAGWDLSWLKPPTSTGQACFAYWVLGVRPDRCVGEIEASIEKVMRESGFPY